MRDEWKGKRSVVNEGDGIHYLVTHRKKCTWLWMHKRSGRINCEEHGLVGCRHTEAVWIAIKAARLSGIEGRHMMVKI